MEFKIICPNCNSEKVDVLATTDLEISFICQDCNHSEIT